MFVVAFHKALMDIGRREQSSEKSIIKISDKFWWVVMIIINILSNFLF